MREYAVANMLLCPPWMGKYPRKGADWSPEEDAALLRAYESGRYLNKELAALHLREPVAIERRLFKLRSDAWLRRRAQTDQEAAAIAQINRAETAAKLWASERETAQQAVSKIKGAFGAVMWPRQRGKSRLGEELRKFKVGDIFAGRLITSIYDSAGMFMMSRIPLDDLPPEVAQALQFGGEA